MLNWVCKRQTTHGSSSDSKYKMNCTENDGGYKQKRASDSMWLNLFRISEWHKKPLSQFSFPSGVCMHFGSPSHRLPIVPCPSASLWHLAAPDSWLHHHLVHSLLHICLLVFVLSLCCSVTVCGGQPADFAVLDPSLSQWLQLLLAVLSCPKLQSAVHAAVTDSF